MTHANGGLQINELVIRLTSDGKAEWEEYVNIDKNQHKSARIPPEQVISIRQRLDAIDKSGFKPQMGPYASYVDVWIELSVELGARNEVLRFSITNPWVPKDLPPPPVRDKYKPMPMEVKSIVCEIDRLRAELTKQPVQEMCESSQKPNK